MKMEYKCITVLLLSLFVLSCRNSQITPAPKIEKIIFTESSKTIYAGDTVTIGLMTEPADAKRYDKIEYRMSEKDIVAIKEESSNDGVVIEGLKRGATVITASANGVMDYCSITVLGGNENVIPHIILENYVFECRENEKRTITATLAGGTPLDNSAFIWSYTEQKVISLETANNVAVFDTLQTGSSVITVSHPKAQFYVDILVYVLGTDEVPVYITTDTNVIHLQTTQSNYQFAVDLYGGNSNDYYGFTMNVTEGNDIIDLQYNNNIGTINPHKNGTAKIRISHSKAAYPMEIVVIVYEEIANKYIDLNKTLVILEENDVEVIIAEFIGDVPFDYGEKFSFEIEDSQVVSVVQSYNYFTIRGLKRGKSIVTIMNEYADFNREVLIIVNGVESMYDREIYITTSQNVITTEVGADDVLLVMTLVGGNEADKNNFVWTVDDGTVIDVVSANGNVQYINRSMAANIGERFEAQALIKAKKVGTAKITLENPKAEHSFSVLVKVYKRGVYDIIPAVINGSSLYRVNIGERLPVRLQVTTGNERYLHDLMWSSGDSALLNVEGAELTGVLEGVNYGITKVIVAGENLKHPYEATVIVGDEHYFSGMPYMFAINHYISVVRGESVFFGIQCENMTENQISAIEVINNTRDIIESFGYRNNVTVTGLELGEGELIFRSPGLNDVRIIVRVEEYEVNPEKPFYLRSEKEIYGMVKGQKLALSVDLVGAGTHNERDLIWSIEDTNIATIEENGKSCFITGVNVGQTIITVKHAKSINHDLHIVIYVVETYNELNTKIVLYMKDDSLLMGKGEARYISVITNANDIQKGQLMWNITGTDVIDYSISGDRVKAYIIAKNAGTAVITVSHSEIMIPAVAYISVINRQVMERYINVPSIVELVVGQPVTINAVTENVDTRGITWSVPDNSVILAYGNGSSCLVNPSSRGNTIITVGHEDEKFKKNILVYVYDSIGEMNESYIIAGEQTRYVINKGDIINVFLVFGTRGYPDHELINIGWSASANNALSVSGNGRSAQITGKNTGVGMVTVTGMNNTVQIEVEVRDNTYKTGAYWFNIRQEDRIKGLLSGDSVTIAVEVWHGTDKVSNITNINYEVENNDIISVESNGLEFMVHAAAGREGQSYITLTHDMAEDSRILIYTSISSFGLDNAYPLFIDKANYLLQKGQSADIMVQTIDNNVSKYNNISYGLQNNNGVIRIAEKDKRNIVVEALGFGSEVILVRYNGITVQHLYVSVTENSFVYNAGYLVTENIIGLAVGDEYETEVQTQEGNSLLWKSDNIYIASIVSSSGKKALIKGVSAGKTTVKVNAGGIERNLLVFVCETKEELDNYEAINIEQRNYRVRKNESINIPVYSIRGTVKGNTVYSDNYNYSPAFGGILKINSSGGNMLSVTGVKEGIAAVRITNSYYNTEIIVYVEVHNSPDGNIDYLESDNYITATRTMYVLALQDSDVMIEVMVAGGDFGGGSYWNWRVEDSDIIDMEYAGSAAVINPKMEGKSKIIVENPYCQNSPFELMVIVGERYAINDDRLPYINIEKDVYEAEKGGEDIIVQYSIMYMDNINASDIIITNYGRDFVKVNNNADMQELRIEPLRTGIARIELNYQNIRRELYVLVKDHINFGNAYLTTSENYVVMSVGEFRTVQTQLVGMNELNSANFNWKVTPEFGVVQAFGNGENGQIYALAEGDAQLVLTHNSLKDFPLTIYVRVVPDKTQVSMAYLTTQHNVIDTVAGAMEEVVYIQKIGNVGANDRIIWNVQDSSIIDIEPLGDYARIMPKKDGITKISVYIENNNNIKLDIVVIVRPSLGNGIYITTEETLIMMKPNDMQRKITAVLVNGNERDNNKFVWSRYGQDIVNSEAALAGANVISILESNNECFINALQEGIARIQITHPNAERALFITVYVTQYERIDFSSSIRNLLVGETSIVSLDLPTYEYMAGRVVLQSSDTAREIVEVYHTNTTVFLKGIGKGTVKLSAFIRGQEDKVAEMAVNVFEEDEPNTNKIIVDKQMFNLSLKSDQLIINAAIAGPNIIDTAQDYIQWVVSPGGEDIVDILPGTKTGRQIQIRAKAIGHVTITVKHTLVGEGYWKTIKIIVAELNNIFSVSRTEITINSMTAEVVTAEIAGGTAKDYNEIQWRAIPQQKWDGTMLEVVRVMGSGQTVMLYPMNDGNTTVLACYGKEIIEIKVNVVNEYYFDFRTGTEYMYPGETRSITYEVRPVSSNVTWINPGLGNEEPVVVFSEVLGSGTVENNTSIRRLFLEARQEGTQTIVGMASSRVASLTVIVNYNYGMNMGYNNVNSKGDTPMPEYPGESDGKSRVNYWVWPPNTYIKLSEQTPLPDGLTMDIIPPIQEGDNAGYGYIEFMGTVEMYKELMFKQYKAKRSEFDPDDPVTNYNSDGRTNVIYRFKEVKPLIYFIRGDGKWTYMEGGEGDNWTKEGNKYKYNGRIHLGDGEEHYLMIQPNYTTAKMAIDAGADDIINNNLLYIRYNNMDEFTAQAANANIFVNGVEQSVILLTGGSDYIEYDRAAYNRELFMYVSSKYIMDIDVTQFPKITVPYYIRDIPVDYEITVPSVKGQWTNLIHPSAVSGGLENIYKTVYLLNDDYIGEAWNFLELASFVQENTWLDQYYGDYTYYFSGDEYTDNDFIKMAQFKLMINMYCRKENVYRPQACYDWNVYLENKAVFDAGDTDLSGLIYMREPVLEFNDETEEYEETGEYTYQITGGVIYSWVLLVKEVEYETRDMFIIIYEYDPEMLANYDDDVKDYLPYDIDNFPHAVYAPDIMKEEDGYDSVYWYSSVCYNEEIIDFNFSGNEIETKYNVFADTFVPENSQGVKIYVPAFLKDTYASGTLSSYGKERRDWIYFKYDNMLTTPSYLHNGMSYRSGMSVSEIPISSTWVGRYGSQFQTGVSPDEFVRRQTGKNTYVWVNKPIYEFLGENQPGANIFARVSDGDEIAYNTYSNYYFAALPTHYYASWFWQNEQWRSVYSPSRVKQKLQWEETGSQWVVPYYFFNRFPYRYDEQPPDNPQPVNVVKLSHDGGKPMPTVRYTPVNGINGKGMESFLRVTYETYDFTGLGDNKIIIEIPVTYYVRPCHSMYMGYEDFNNISKQRIYQGIIEQAHKNGDGNIIEYEGRENTFEKLRNFMMQLNDDDARKKLYVKMNKYNE